MKYLSKLIIFICLFSISACQSFDFEGTGMDKKLVRGGGFVFTTYQRITDKTKPFIFYIEGDGAAFKRGMPNYNPTPRNPVALRLSSLDKRPNVVYIARPCQFTPMSENPKCDSRYWTTHRMSPDSIAAINEVINKINNGQRFTIAGFSGGGAVAPLIATRNNLAKEIITIAGNLNHVAFSRHHGHEPKYMSPSLNPIDFAENIKHIPQLHLSGDKDKRVPAFLAADFTNKVNSFGSKCATHKVLSKTTHGWGWENHWSEITSSSIKCN